MSRLKVAVMVLLSLLTSLASAQESSPDQAPPDGWHFVAVRPETAPVASVRHEGDARGLVITGNGDAIADGRWVKRLPLPQASHVRFGARFRADGIEMLSRNVVACLVWIDGAGKEIANPEFASTTSPADADGWRAIAGVFAVPARAKEAQLELRLRWSPRGQVEFRDAALQPAAAPAPRLVHVATINHRPRNTKSSLENLRQFAALIDQAGAAGAGAAGAGAAGAGTDIVCLPEGCTLIGTGRSYLDCAEPIPGPATEFLGRCALKNKT
jgi:hypothetical protein